MTDAAARFAWRLVAGCALLVGLAMTQSAGLIVPDTKLDLAIAPMDFLGRAAHLWDGDGAFGQLQNQAYGYLWPMGPFFASGALAGLVPWVVQRLWMALVLCVAFVGTAKVARALGVRSDLACLLGGVAYALSPRMLTVIGPSSIEVWPMALAPWVLLPLVLGAHRGSPRRAAALSALAIGMVGGVNAAATAAVLPLGALWLLTRSPGVRRRTMMIWWPVFTALATLWWLVPLFLLGTYSPPFLDFIETASVTTNPTNLADALRGTSNWVPYVDSASRAGNDLIRDFYLAVNSSVVLAVGVWGLALRRSGHRLFLLSGLVTGLFLVSMGHTGAVEGWAAATVQDLLDGALAPLRNVHKFDPVLRLPVVIGLAWTVDWLVARTAREGVPRSERMNYRFLSGLVGFAVLAAATPAFAGRLTPAGGFDGVPQYWSQAADWLATEQDSGVALLVPGSMFGTYVWGSPRDEPFQPLASTPWAVRNAVPLTPAGNIRMLDAIEERFAQGHGSAGLVSYLRRAGVSHLVVRNDLSRDEDHPDPVLVHQAILDSPGLRLAATFGPTVGGEASIDGRLGRTLINGGWQSEYPAVEVYELDDPPPQATGVSVPPVVVGGPEDLLDLSDLGVLADDVPTVLALDQPDGPSPDAPMILTDGYRAVERHFGRVHDGTSPVLTRAESEALTAPTADYELSDSQRWSTVAEYDGISSVSASSSASDAGSGPSALGRLPFAALDDDVSTSWQSSPWSEDSHWWQVDLDGTGLSAVTVTGALTRDQDVVLSTDDWTSDVIELAPNVPTPIRLGDDESPFLRISDASGRRGTPLILSEVRLPGVRPARVLRLPEPPAGAGAPDAIVLRAIDDARTGCAVVEGELRCAEAKVGSSEEPGGFARRFVLPESSTYDTRLMVRPVLGAAYNALLDRGSLVGVTASSTAVQDPRASARAAIDGNAATTWAAAPSELHPSVTLRWVRPQRLREVRLSTDLDVAARRPESVVLRWNGRSRTVELDSGGRGRFPSIRTDEVVIEVEDAASASDLGFDSTASVVPIGITELSFPGAEGLPLLPSPRAARIRCGTGPDVFVGDRRLQTSVRASTADLMAGREVPARLCGAADLALGAGEVTVTVAASAAFRPTSLVLSRGEMPIGGSPLAVGADAEHDGAQIFDPPTSPVVFAGHQNANLGWEATQDTRSLTPVVIDGWRQGWRTSGPGVVEARFAPGATYRHALLLGLGAALSLLVLVLGFSRRWRRGLDQPAVGERTVRPWLLCGLAPVVGAVLAGPTGAAIGLVAMAATLGLRILNGAVDRVLTGALAMAAVGAYAFWPWGTFASWAGTFAWPSYFVLASVAGLLAVLAGDSRRRSLP